MRRSIAVLAAGLAALVAASAGAVAGPGAGGPAPQKPPIPDGSVTRRTPVIVPDRPAGGGIERIGVLEVDTPGLSAIAGDKLEQGVEDGLAGVGFEVIRSHALHQTLADSNLVDGCTFGPCLREIYRQTGLRLVLVAHIEGEGQSYSYVVSLLDTRTGKLTSQVAQACPACTMEDAISTATLAVIELVTGTGDAAVADPRAGPTGALRLDLPPPTPRRAAGDGPRRARRAGWTLVSIGTAAAVVGGLLWASGAERSGAAIGGGGLGVAAGGTTVLLFSRRF